MQANVLVFSIGFLLSLWTANTFRIPNTSSIHGSDGISHSTLRDSYEKAKQKMHEDLLQTGQIMKKAMQKSHKELAEAEQVRQKALEQLNQATEQALQKTNRGLARAEQAMEKAVQKMDVGDHFNFPQGEVTNDAGVWHLFDRMVDERHVRIPRRKMTDEEYEKVSAELAQGKRDYGKAMQDFENAMQEIHEDLAQNELKMKKAVHKTRKDLVEVGEVMEEVMDRAAQTTEKAAHETQKNLARAEQTIRKAVQEVHVLDSSATDVVNEAGVWHLSDRTVHERVSNTWATRKRKMTDEEYEKVSAALAQGKRDLEKATQTHEKAMRATQDDLAPTERTMKEAVLVNDVVAWNLSDRMVDERLSNGTTRRRKMTDEEYEEVSAELAQAKRDLEEAMQGLKNSMQKMKRRRAQVFGHSI